MSEAFTVYQAVEIPLPSWPLMRDDRGVRTGRVRESMRGVDAYNGSLFSTVRLESFVPASHPLRPIRQWVNETLASMEESLSRLYAADLKGGRPSIAPEKLVQAGKRPYCQ